MCSYFRGSHGGCQTLGVSICPYVHMTPVCLEASMFGCPIGWTPPYLWIPYRFGYPPYVWMQCLHRFRHPHMLGCPIGLDTPICLDAPIHLGASEHMEVSKHMEASKHIGDVHKYGGFETYRGHMNIGGILIPPKSDNPSWLTLK